MRVIIYGAGAIGSVVGGHLAHADSQVVLIGRPGHVKIVSERGLRLLTPTGTYLVKAPAVTAPSQVSFRPDDVVFLCVKSQDTDGALRDLKQAIGDVPIFCFQNGVCNEGNASRYFSRVYGVRVRLGAVFLTEGEAISLSSPPGWLIMGRYPTGIDDLLEAVAANLRNAGFDILLTPDVMPYKWGKLMLNLGNAVGALSSEKSDSSNLIRISRAARQEAQDILSQAGISIRWATDEEEKQQWPQRKPLLGTLSVEAKDSTWQSLARRKGTVEADFLNGEIVRLARQIGKQAPINETLLRLVNEVAAKRELPGKYTSAELLQLVGLR